MATTVALIIAVGFSSCAKCKVCTKKSEAEVRLCEKDYNSNTEYGLRIDSYENNGYACKTSI